MQSHPIAAPGANLGATGDAPQPPGEAAIAQFLGGLRFDAQGLVAAVAQQHDTGEVLMLAWMNREAVAETLRTGRVTYYSRSRKGLWRKGDTSGHSQWVKAVSIDCDGDALLVEVDQVGAACHTGAHSCFEAGGDLGAVRGEAS